VVATKLGVDGVGHLEQRMGDDRVNEVVDRRADVDVRGHVTHR
jgi:hypothetical protein